MEDSWRQIMPQTKFGLISNDELYTNQRRSLDLLYQPILGSNAYTLINILWEINDHHDMKLKYHTHFEILNLLGIGMKAFCDARKKLEGAGLLKTLLKKKPDVSDNLYIYELISPVSVNDFFNDDLLSLALLEIVGENYYQNLIHRLFHQFPKYDGFKDISHNFLEAYQVSHNKITHHPKISHHHEGTFVNDQSIQAPNFDFKMLLNILSSSYVDTASIKRAHQLIVDINRMYGIDEIDMAKLIERSTNITTNRFDTKKLKILIARIYQSKQSNVDIDPDSKISNQSSSGDFSKDEQELINATKEYAPMEFLQSLKGMKHGMISSNERWTIKEIMNQSSLKTSVINMLIYHILIDEQRTNLKRSYFDTIADNWSQKQINTPEQAIQYIKLRDNNANEKHYQKNAYHRNGKPKIKETLPEWAKEDYHPKYKKASLATRKRVKEKLKRLNHDMKEGR
ncbi:helicase DnaB [Philodulcilactobacillus myokoensis]|uniref:Helicase DnaB n=1 Tax=Philodulcilactobacillus myokoensis TaxID=2929573 RepID=A0A9W6B0Q3_9LACO|nr:DnaD domain protein [Philodulcilactobacillus myokoensis]GLB46750.1 helicase DnaB [Philodulcilactobacillus myokoensis]